MDFTRISYVTYDTGNTMSANASAPVVEASSTEAQTKKMSTEEIRLVQWEEWALSLEEHFHAQELYARNPSGNPMGHR